MNAHDFRESENATVGHRAWPHDPLKPHCDYCGDRLVPSGCTTGGGQYQGADGKTETLCFACCGFADVITMARAMPGERSSVGFYYDPVKAIVTNWPGTLRLPATPGDQRRGGFGSKRRQVYFRGPEGSFWAGTHYDGNAGDLLRNVRRLKS